VSPELPQTDTQGLWRQDFLQSPQLQNSRALLCLCAFLDLGVEVGHPFSRRFSTKESASLSFRRLPSAFQLNLVELIIFALFGDFSGYAPNF
jgi:hypothetical protein